MASILKIPTENSKGVLIFTSREKVEFIDKNKEIHKRIELLKNNWIVGLHHNWHDFKYYHDSLYDFNMAGETDLISADGKDFFHIPIECTHFTPNVFEFSNTNKMWDILYVGKAVGFKKIPEFFKSIRALYDQGLMYRVLFISPVPPQCKKNIVNPAYFCNIREVYNKMFNAKERKLFNLLTLEYEYPFPFDLETLSYFYKSSRVFVFTSDDERRPRTVAYAIASGMPTVLMKSVASLLPLNKQIKPYVYLADSYNEYPKLISEAIEFTKSENYTKERMKDSMQEFNIEQNLLKLRNIFKDKFFIDLFEDNRKYALLYNLDIRLARHYGFGEDGHSVGWSLESLLNYLEQRSFKEMMDDMNGNDFERDISNLEIYGKKETKILANKSLIGKFKMLLLPLYYRYEFLQKFYKRIKDKK